MALKQALAQSSLIVADPSTWPAIISEVLTDIHPADQWVQPDREKPPVMADVKQARFSASQIPFGKGKVLVFLWADTFNPPVANALLKLLEEPPANVHMVLLSATDRVIPTIRSRVRSLRLDSPKSQEMKNDWKDLLEHYNPEIRAERARLSELLYLTPLVHATVQTNTLTEGYSAL